MVSDPQAVVGAGYSDNTSFTELVPDGPVTVSDRSDIGAPSASIIPDVSRGVDAHRSSTAVSDNGGPIDRR